LKLQIFTVGYFRSKTTILIRRGVGAEERKHGTSEGTELILPSCNTYDVMGNLIQNFRSSSDNLFEPLADVLDFVIVLRLRELPFLDFLHVPIDVAYDSWAVDII